VHQQSFAVEIRIRIDGISSRKAGEQAAMKLCATARCTVNPSQGPAPTTIDRSASGGCVLVVANVVSMRISVSSRACEKGSQARQQQFVGEKRRHIQPDDGARPVADLSCSVTDSSFAKISLMLLEIVGAGVGQGERAHSAFEQGDAELFLERLDLGGSRRTE